MINKQDNADRFIRKGKKYLESVDTSRKAVSEYEIKILYFVCLNVFINSESEIIKG